MSESRKVRRFLRLAIPGREAERAVNEEIGHHILERIDELVEEGYRPEAARREAERCFGDLPGVRRQCVSLGRRKERVMIWGERFKSILQDIRYSLRGIGKNPSFAVAVILTLGLGIGANGAVFSVVDTVLFRPLPYQEPETVVQPIARDTDNGFGFYDFPYESAIRLKAESEFLESLGFFSRTTVVRTDSEFPTRTIAFGLSESFLEMLGVGPALGRGFLPGDHEGIGERVVLLGDEAWREWSGGEVQFVGEEIEFDGVAYRVIGVLPPQFKLLGDFGLHVFFPMSAEGAFGGVTADRVRLFGRLAPGVSVEVANQRGTALMTGLLEQGLSFLGAEELVMHQPTADRVDPDASKALLLMLGAAVMLLLVAFTNGINLFLIRGSVRAKELGVRLSLGGSNGRIRRQLLTEGLTLAFIGGLLGVLVAYFGVEGLMSVAPQIEITSNYHLQADGRTLLYIFLVTLAVGTSFGLIPARFLLRKNRALQLVRRTEGSSLSRRWGFGRSLNVVSQLALALVLLAGAGLLGRSFLKLMSVDPGFDVDRVVLMTVDLAESRYAEVPDREVFYQRLIERVEALPGVVSTSLDYGNPTSPIRSYGNVLEVEGSDGVSEKELFEMPNAYVSEGFMETYGVRLSEGRFFQPGETRESNVVLIDREMAGFLWGDEPAVGRRLRTGGEGSPWLTVIGVVEGLRLLGQDDRTGPNDLLRPAEGRDKGATWTLAVRTSGNPASILGPLRGIVRDLDPQQPIYSLATGEESLAEERVSPRFYTLILLFFALIGVTLAGTGVYGVLAYSLSQRKREVGIRMAVGAAANRVQRMVVWEGLKLATFGILIGLGGSVLCSRLLESLLFDVAPGDVRTLCIMTLFLLALVVVTSYLPARRATRIDPMKVLKAD